MELFECFFLRDNAAVEEVEENEAGEEPPHCPAKDELLEAIEVYRSYRRQNSLFIQIKAMKSTPSEKC